MVNEVEASLRSITYIPAKIMPEGKKHFDMLNVHVYCSGNDEKENKNAKPSKVIIKTMKLKSEIAALVLLV